MNRQSIVTVLSVLAALTIAGCTSNDAAKRKLVASADSYAANRQYKEAIVQYRNAIQKDPRFAEARLKLARTYEQSGDRANAFREFVRVADLLPEDDDVQLAAGRYLFLARQFEDAKGRANRVLARSPKNVTARVLLGNALAGLKDLDAAVTEMETAAADSPGEAIARTGIGYLQMAKGNKGQAERAFTDALAADPKSVPARLALANFYLADNRLDEAEHILKEAHGIDANDALANRALAMFYVATKRLPEAEPYIKAVADVTKDGWAQLALADYYVQSKRDDEARRLLTDLSAAKETFAEANMRLAEMDQRQGQTEQAYARLEQVLARQPKHARALTMRGRLRLAEKKTAEAIKDLQAAVAADSAAATPHVLLATAYQSTNASAAAIREYEAVLKIAPGSTLAQAELARLYLSTGRSDLAVQYGERAATAAPASVDARLLFARALTAHRDTERAESELQALVKQFPESAEARAALGTLYLGAQNWIQARRWFETAVALDAKSIEAATGLARVEIGTKHPAEARQRLETRVAQTPADPALNLAAAASFAQMGDARRAEELLLKTIEQQPSRLAAYVLLGRLYLSEKRLDEAKAQFDTLLAKEPTSVGTATMLGMIHEMQERPAEAQKMYEKALQVDPAAPVAANNLAWILANNGTNLDIALQLAQAAKRKLPEEANVNDTLGWIYYKKDMAAQAIPAFQESVRQAPANPEFQFHLGLAYAKAGNPERAKVALSAALKLNPAFKGANEARQLLASLGD